MSDNNEDYTPPTTHIVKLDTQQAKEVDAAWAAYVQNHFKQLAAQVPPPKPNEWERPNKTEWVTSYFMKGFRG